MDVSYLKAVLRAGLGTAFSEDTRSRNKPYSSGLQLQQPIQNPFPFSTALWGNEDEHEDVAEEVVFDEFFGNTSPPAKPGPMDDQESGAEQKVESDRYLPKPITDTNEEIIGEASFAQDNSLPILKKADADLHSTSELKMGRSDVKNGEKEVKEDKSGAQNIANKIDIQQIEVKRVQLKASDRIPTVEVVKQTAIRVPSSDQSSSPSSVSQLVEINLPSQELNKNQQGQRLKDSSLQIDKSPEQFQPQPPKTKIVEPQEENILIPLDIAEQKKVKESETPINVTQVIQKQSKQNLNAHFFMQTSKEGKAHIGKNKDQKREMPEQLQPQHRKSIIAGPQKERIQIPSDIAEQEKVHEPEALMKSVKVVQKPTSQQNLNAFFFTKSLKKNETQTAKIAKDIALINKKLDEHISKEQPEPVRPAFLPKRPASRNLGGWSNLERNYIR